MSPSLARAVLFLAVLLASGRPVQSQAPASDWPHLRGPNMDAISREKGLVDTWPKQGPPILWTRELGQGYSGFVVAAGRAYTQFQTRSGQYIICLDADTGAEIWRQRIDWPWQPSGAYPGPYATPTWHAGLLYYATPGGKVGCLDADSGRSIWSVDVQRKFHGTGTEFGYAATPLVEAGKVFLPVGGPDASVVALDARDGSTVWSSGDDSASYCPLYPITFRGRRLLVAFLRNSLAAHDMSTGKRLWRVELSQYYDEHSAWPLYAEPHLLISSPFRAGSRLYRLEHGKESPVRPLWANKELCNDVCSSVLVGGHVYGFDLQQLQASPHRASRGRFKCLDFLTGKVQWQTDRTGQATVLAADGKLILLNDTGTLILLRVTPTRYEELARCRVLEGGLCWTPPALWQGRLYVRNPSRAACVFLGPPETLDPDRETVALPLETGFDLSRFLTREPDYPHDVPLPREVALWFLWCVVGVFGAAAVVGVVAALVARSRFWGRAVFVAAALLLGLAGTTVFSAWADTFILTWPASLYVVFRLTLAVVLWAEATTPKARPRLAARAMTVFFLACCFGYYRLCLVVGYVMAWGFLAGFLPAAPAAIVAARARRLSVRLLAESLAFAVYFWMSGMAPGWKDLWLG